MKKTIQRVIKRKFLDRTDSRVMRLMMDLGLEGYAVYALLANMTGGGKGCDYDPEALAFDFRTTADIVRSVAEQYSLFSISGSDTAPTENISTEDVSAENTPAENAPTEKCPATLVLTPETNGVDKRKERKKETETFPLHPHKEKEINKETENRGGAENKKSGDKNETKKQSNTETPEETERRRQAKQKFIDAFMRYWNDALQTANSKLRPICMVDDRRYALLWRLYHKFSREQVARFVFNAARSPYLNARNGRLKQPADINWMLASEERIVKIIEGNL